MDKGQILERGFEVRRADNGGFVVLALDDDHKTGRGRILAALGNGDALVEWLRQEVRADQQEKARAELPAVKADLEKAQRTAPAKDWRPQ